MPDTHLHRPDHPNKDVPEELAPSRLPIEPDEGPIPPLTPHDPAHEREVDPGAAPVQVVATDVFPLELA